jgi:hypothetical protein
MKLELELWHLISLALAFFGASATAAKMLLAQAQRHMDDRFKSQEVARASNHEQLSLRLDRLELAARDESGNWARVERELHEMKADLPLNYVRREDYIRGQSIVEAKLDGLATKIDNVQLRAALADRGKP